LRERLLLLGELLLPHDVVGQKKKKKKRVSTRREIDALRLLGADLGTDALFERAHLPRAARRLREQLADGARFPVSARDLA